MITGIDNLRPGALDFTMPQGSVFRRVLTIKVSGTALDLTDFTARMQIRSSHAATSTVADLTTANGKIVLGGTAGTVTLLLSATVTAAITAGTYVYDLELVDTDGEPLRWVEGTVTVTPEVTR